jgi:cholesterol oxidase
VFGSSTITDRGATPCEPSQRAVDELKPSEHYDTVVVGTGFGGSVVGYRLAQAGKSVCILERGRAYPPGSFPRDPSGLTRNLWDPNNGLYGMFDVWSFRGLESLVCSGLGGGSLIYANVLLRKPESWFVREDPRDGSYEYWPITREDLEPHYDAAEAMLGAQTYPFHASPYRETSKTRAMKYAAASLGLDWELPNLAVTFANEGRPPVPGESIDNGERNLHGAARSTCRLCGECDIGCNYGAKNTLDYNYLSRAKEHGADIHTLSEVRRIEPAAGGGYLVTYVRHDPARARSRKQLRSVTVKGDRLVLSAGAFGSPLLLFRNRSAFPGLSGALGTHFCGNGDLLTFIRSARSRRKEAELPWRLGSSQGPVITSAISVPDTLDGRDDTGRGFYVQDGGNPAFLSWLVEATSTPSIAARSAVFFMRRAWAHLTDNPRSNYSAQVAGLVRGADRSSSFLPLLAMGRDVADGVMSLRGGDLEVNWTTETSKEYFDRAEAAVANIARALGGRHMNTPLWLFKRVITVHPLGGCPMGRDRSEGVVDSWGQSFDYPGLYVADGSVMPGPVGPNPSLTIAAFADRVAEGILER